MTHVDQYGLDFTTDSDAAASAYRDALDLGLTNHIGVKERLVSALELDPGFGLARALLAFHLQFNGDAAAPVTQIVVAAQHAKRATPRERQVVQAFRLAFVGDTVAARLLINQHLRDFPRDALMIREYLLLNAYGGGTGRKASAAALLHRLAPHMGSDPWFMGVYSLALSEVGDVESAARLAETALEARPDHGVVAHARAHIHFESGDVSAGRDFLHDWLATYSAGSLDGGHLTWHLALTYLALSEPGLALEVYRHQRTTNRTQALSLEDSVSLLWRLHLRGVDVSAEWSAVIDRRPSESPQRAFQLAHVAFAMAAQRDTDGLRRLTEEVTHAMTARPQEPLRYLLPLLDGLRLVALEQWADAAPALATAAVGALRLGGSNEQHTLFAETVAFAESHA